MENASKRHQEEEDIDLLEFWRVIWGRKKMIIVLFTVSVMVTMIISMLLPKYYASETIILPIGSEGGGLGAALSAIPMVGALTGAVGLQTPADKIMVILKSRTLAEKVIRKFDLFRLFNERDWDDEKKQWKDPADPPLMQDAVKKLAENVVNFRKSKDGSITIEVEWKDANLSADIANYYVTALAAFMNDMSINVTVQVIDRAIPAERKSKPKVSLNMALAGVLSGFVGIFLAFFLDYLDSRKRAL